MSTRSFNTIQAFIKGFPDGIKDSPALQKALGVGSRAGDLYWAALYIVEDDEVLSTPNLPTLAKKLGFTSATLAELKRKGLLKSSGYNKYSIGGKGVKKIAKILEHGLPPDGETETAPATSKKKSAKKRKPSKKAAKKGREKKPRATAKKRKPVTARPKPASGNKYVRKLRAELDALDNIINEAVTKRDDIQREMRELLDMKG